MSDPSRLLQSLRLDEMPVTRSQAHSAPHRGGRHPRASQGRGRGAPRPETPSQALSPQVTPVRSFTGHQYYTQALSPLSARRATEGLESNFAVDRVQSYDSGREKYYAFQLRLPVAVRIYEPDGDSARVECSCEGYQTSQSECPHIYWLFAGLHAVLTDLSLPYTQAPIPIEISLTSQLGRLYPLIQQKQASLRQELNRFGAYDIDSELDDPQLNEPFSVTDLEVRTDVLCDILSSFDSDTTPAEFKGRFLENPTEELSPSDSSSLVQGSLPATILHLASRDDALFRSLQQVVPRDIRATQYYKTQFNKAQIALQGLSEYSETGQTAQRMPGNDSNHGVAACARALRSIVNEICEDRDRRTAVAPLSVPVLRRLAEILTRLVGQVVAWDSDIYSRAQWNRIRPQNEHPRDRNLFAYLIGDPPSGHERPHWMADHFVIDRLRNFPSSEWSHLLELLTTIKDAIEEKDMEILPGSFSYVAKIDKMVQDYTATAEEPSSSSVQMPRRV